MFDENFIRKLKQVNISKNPDKTRLRVEELWKSAPKSNKHEVERLAGVVKGTIYRIYRTGSITAKLAVPMAQEINVNPYYLTGESDEKGECTDELMNQFLVFLGYEDLLKKHYKETKRKSRKNERQSVSENEKIISDELESEEDEQLEENETSTPSVEEVHDLVLFSHNVSLESQAFIDRMTEDEMVLLLRASILRAKAGGRNAELLRKIKLLLLS